MISVDLDSFVICNSILSLVFIWVIWCMNAVRRHDKERNEWNEKEWRIELFPSQAYFVKFINVNGFGLGKRMFIVPTFYLIKILSVLPALERSLSMMEKAEANGTVDKILCDSKARQEMKDRINKFTIELRDNTYIYPVSKVFFYMRTKRYLDSHRAFLELAMNKDVAKEKIVAPIYIPSLPRTGTTILHRVMALDKSRFRNFDLCDTFCFAPPVPRWDKSGRKELAKKAQKECEKTGFLYSNWRKSMKSIHEIVLSNADEDLNWFEIPTGHSFRDYVITMYPNSRLSDINSLDQARYRLAWLELTMKVYQYVDKVEWRKRYGNEDCPDCPWILKDPMNGAYCQQLIERFPDIKFVFIHRSFEQILSSNTKNYQISNSVHHVAGAPETTSKTCGREMIHRLKSCLDSIEYFTASQEKGSLMALPEKLVNKDYPNGIHATQRRIDFYFRDLVLDVPKAICFIYKTFFPDQPGPSDEALKAFNAYLDKHALANRTKVRYPTLEEMSTSSEELHMLSYRYNNMFGL